MKLRIRSIFWLMTCCIVAINAFQGYWLWTTYRLNKQQFIQTAQNAMFQVVEAQQLADADHMFGKDHEKMGDVNGVERSRMIIKKFRTPDSRRASMFFTSSDTPADTLAKRLSNKLMLGWTKGGLLDLTKFKKIYRAEMARRGISTDFTLDTLTIKPKKKEDNVYIFNSEEVAVEDGSGLSTVAMPINPIKNQFVKATFLSPFSYLLRQMAWLLGSSMFLLMLTSSCFIFMLTTILRQKKLSEIKNDFINNMTHELKTPIATVTAAVDALMHFGAINDPGKAQAYLQISHHNLQHLAAMVEKVLNLAVDEKRELTLNREPVSLAVMVQELVDNHQLKAQKLIYFDTDIPAEAVVCVDSMHFSNALNNLIDNAINYSYDQVRISMCYKREADNWRLIICDNGIGIPKAYHGAIFERFFRVPTGDLHQVKGFGLGLAYVQQVMQRHGGKIRVSSELEKGSKFILEF
ncbi:HAMP domain-containing histidine kinase [Dyadobacter chenwenxiniae]|uniref:histidine kinase n=1 Tax=Dyadobacter chenwenxiniae TaxID=2906456 RepID=A0A9X1PKM0_9BACT|nr:HAMP domain-containing sensor histidine kinase [Dyadobacter chenwenxiniae]MCF0060531.1 HAMP domain-containing histidine kinase [Dyadobacter chenwenxiniae]UON86262.1 HAMP domain-containing histidine kinase [Dyadobacter chenwenxiniae]